LKIIHTADIHLGSKMESKFPKEKADVRKKEVRSTFLRLIDYAASNGVKVVLLSGDVFDSDRPFKKDKEFFYGAIRSNPDIDFLYLCGNHDGMENYTTELPNLKTFGEEWTVYEYGNIAIWGIEMTGGNAVSLYTSLKADPDKINIVMLHGTACDSTGQNLVNLAKMRNRNVDYLALGHIHSYGGIKALDDRGVWAYSGCLEGRGFDETGEKGFILLDVGEKVRGEFIPFAKRKIADYSVDLTGLKDFYECKKAVEAAIDCSASDIVRVVLTGAVEFDDSDLAEDVEKALDGKYFFLSAKNKTENAVHVEKILGEISLRGEFARIVTKSDMDAGEKGKVLAMGLKALAGKGGDIL